MSLGVLWVIVATVVTSVSSVTITVPTEYGLVTGTVVNVIGLQDQAKVNSFLGIPFAKPPIDELRFEEPLPPDSWSIFNATYLRSVCMQDLLGTIWMTHPGWTDSSEDCLNLNIFAPNDKSRGPYAVMVWFTGGGYTSGANIQYPGHFLAAKDVVVVVPNYRLGAFGFLATPDHYIEGNMGMYDQIAALEFVRDNIAHFGGDPNRVTIFGQSAGASSASLLMVSPKAQGLFHQSIGESGTESNFWSMNFPAQVPEDYVYQTAEKLSCETASDTALMIDCMRRRPAGAVRLAQDLVCTPGHFCQGYAPIIDGPGGFMPSNPLELRNELKENSIPIMTGITRDDGSLYTFFYIPESNEGDGFNRTEFHFYIQDRLLSIWEEQMTPEVYDAMFHALDFYYTPWPYIEDHWDNREAMNKMVTDSAFGMPMDRQAKTNSEWADTYVYVMAYRSANADAFVPEWMGVPHMGELPYVWGYPNLVYNDEVRADSQIYFDVIPWTFDDAIYADFIETLWSNFAKFGNPTPTPVKAPFEDAMMTWEKFSMSDNLKVFYMDNNISIATNYKQQNYAFSREYTAYITGKPI